MWIFKHWNLSEANLTVQKLSDYDEALSYLQRQLKREGRARKKGN